MSSENQRAGRTLSEAALRGYTIEKQEFLGDIDSDAWLLRHDRTGARIVVLPNGDANKVFYIAFRTPPADSTGVAHIIEHTVLCGSRDFPVKDPFIELAKGSLNTFLNAMTYPDKTVYPVASCNEQDFRNLMHVYLDAVFYPRIYDERRIFEQEGWHYELPEGEERLVINGVVYNEMKGVMSDPDSVLEREVMRSLFPHTPYGVESGGDPEEIPALDYESYLEFHRRYYHPSNSYIYLYGNADMEERLRYLDDHYLSRFDALPVDSAVPSEEQFDAPAEADCRYSILEDEEEQGRSYLSWNLALPAGLDPERDITFRVLDYVLCDAEGGPLKKALLRQNLGSDVSSTFEAGLLEPVWSVVIRGAEPEGRQRFAETIEATLRKLADKGLDRRALEAGISHHEFRYREADFGSYPKGLVFGLSALDTWLYEDLRPFEGLKDGARYEALRQKIGTGYFEEFIRTYMLDNRHRSVLVLRPEKGLTQKRDRALDIRLAEQYRQLAPEALEAIRHEEERLREYQNTADSPEALSCIPMLGREDLERRPLPYINSLRDLETGQPLPEPEEGCGVSGEGVSGEAVPWEQGRTRLLAHPVFTNGICYVTLLFDMRQIPERLYRMLPVLRTSFAALGTARHDYASLNEEINIRTGGIQSALRVLPVSADGSYRFFLSVSMKALRTGLEGAFALLGEILRTTDWHDRTQLQDVIAEEYSDARTDLAASGHSTAATRAMSYFSEAAAVTDDMSGIGGYRLLRDVKERFDRQGGEIMDALADCAAWCFVRERCALVDVTAPEEDLPAVQKLAHALVSSLPGAPSRPEGEPGEGDAAALPGQSGRPADAPYRIRLEKKNEGFMTAGQVQFVCRAGSFAGESRPYTGALRVLRVIMAYDYLWKQIRELGGAYGCMSSFSRDGSAFLVSYRDPHLMRTEEVYRGIPAYLRNFDVEERTMTQYVIGTISGLDAPLTPSAAGRYSLGGFLTGVSEAELAKEREEILHCTADDIRRLADYVESILEDEVFCVVGSREKITGAGERFGAAENLL